MTGNAFENAGLDHAVAAMKGNGDDHDKTRFVKLSMGSNGTNVNKAVCLQDFDDTPIRFDLHAKTGSMMSVFA